MVKKSKTYRLQEVTLLEISETKERFSDNGIEMSDAEIIQKAVFEYWMRMNKYIEMEEKNNDIYK